MGTLPNIITGQSTNFGEIVNLYTAQKAHFILDTETVKLDVDNDNISDNKDLCDNSIPHNNILSYGCIKMKKSILERPIIQKQPNTFTIKQRKKVRKTTYTPPQYKPRKTFPENYETKKTYKPKKYSSSLETFQVTQKKKVKKIEQKPTVERKHRMYGDDSFSDDWEENDPLKPGSFIEENLLDKTLNHKKIPIIAPSSTLDSVVSQTKTKHIICHNVPISYRLDANGCAKSSTITIPSDFEDINVALSSDIEMKIAELAQFLQQNPQINIDIVGHSSRSKNSNYNYNLILSKSRAKRFQNELLKYGIEKQRTKIYGKSFEQPIADNKTAFGRKLNRRIEIIFKSK